MTESSFIMHQLNKTKTSPNYILPILVRIPFLPLHFLFVAQLVTPAAMKTTSNNMAENLIT